MNKLSSFLFPLSSPKAFLLGFVFFLLPWQTHLLISEGVVLGSGISPFTSVKLYAVEMLVVLTALVSIAVKKDRPTMDTSYRLPIALACCIVVIATLSISWSAASIVSFGAFLHVAVAMLLFVLLLDKKLPLMPLLCAFGAGLIIPALLGIVQVAYDASPASTVLGIAARDAMTLGDAVTVHDGVRELRAYGSFPHPNVFGGYLAVGVLALQSFVVKSEKRKVKRWLLAAMMVLTVALVLTGSRSAILGLLLGIGLAGFVRRVKNTATARLAVIPIAIAVISGAWFATIFAPNVVAGLRGGGVGEERSLSERVEQYYKYPLVVDGLWIAGHGVGTYVITAHEKRTCTDWSCQPIHNVPLLIVGEIGIIGALIVFAWSSSIDRINFARFPNRDALVAFAMGNVVLVILFFDHYIWSSWPGLSLIALVMALTVRMGEE